MGSLGYVRRSAVFLAFVLLTSFVLSPPAFAQGAASSRPSVSGVVGDALGTPVSGATVSLVSADRAQTTAPKDTKTDAKGAFAFGTVPEGRYELRVVAPGFNSQTVAAFFVGASGRDPITISLQTGLAEHVVVTATATEVPASQVAASVTVVDHAQLDALQNPDVLNAFRLVPGVNIVQTGSRGGPTSLFTRGGNSNFTKVLVDGVPMNDIGGGVDFSNLAATGVDALEVLRDPNSAMYGSDAMAGVVNITTRRGRTRVPQGDLTLDGGNLSTSNEGFSLGGVVRRFDYFSEVSHFDTDNAEPNNAFRITSYAGRFGGLLGRSVLLTGTVRASDSHFGSPNAVELFGIADDSTVSNTYLFGSAAATLVHSDRWQSVVRFGAMSRSEHFLNPTPTGQAFDPFGFGANYLGNTVTITGANGDSVTGRAILDFGGTYPSPFTSNAGRDTVSGQTTYRLSDHFEASGGLRVDHERGAAGVADSPAASTRNDAGGFGELRATTGRLFATGSVGVDHDKSFGNAVTPRGSVAYYVRKPMGNASVGGTKLTFNAGTGIKAPSVSQEASSLFAVAQTVPSLATAGIQPIGPERTRGVDGGIEQAFWGERLHARATVFDNHFSDIIEFVSNTVLPQLGVPTSVASALPGGVYVNSSSYYARGVETSMDVQVTPAVRLSASYTYLSTKVTKSFTGGVLAPAINPAFPNTPIGAFAPLLGAAQFRRPANSGTLAAFYVHRQLSLAASVQFAGKSDDSDFLSDAFFGNSMLLPNHNLDAGYAKVDVTGAYTVHGRIKAFVAVENLLNQNYAPVFGFAALPRTARVGVTLSVGGDAR
jgi:iron complex outermembrane receptor protein/vitamin B12 transporter